MNIPQLWGSKLGENAKNHAIRKNQAGIRELLGTLFVVVEGPQVGVDVDPSAGIMDLKAETNQYGPLGGRGGTKQKPGRCESCE